MITLLKFLCDCLATLAMCWIGLMVLLLAAFTSRLVVEILWPEKKKEEA